jgi:endonuclease YncB( thermonuclease family)
LTRAEAVKLGQQAKAFTAEALRRPFTIQPRWRKVFRPTRYYAFVFTADGNDLAGLLIRNGLAYLRNAEATSTRYRFADNRPGGLIPMAQMKHDIVAKARQSGGDAVTYP